MIYIYMCVCVYRPTQQRREHTRLDVMMEKTIAKCFGEKKGPDKKELFASSSTLYHREREREKRNGSADERETTRDSF